MRILRTPAGLRLIQHGVVISELRTSPGPTHSVFDVLAALIAVLNPEGRVGILGFAGGGMMAPLRALQCNRSIDAVDLDRTGYDLFRRHCAAWTPFVHWHEAEAAEWLRKQKPAFGLLMDDLSIPGKGDVFKPEISWAVLPGLIRHRLKPGGIAVFNLMQPAPRRWNPEFDQLAGGFPAGRVIHFQEFENRILIAGDTLPSARALGEALRRALREIRSHQAERIQVRHWKSRPPLEMGKRVL